MKTIKNTMVIFTFIIILTNNLYSDDFWEQITGPDCGASIIKIAPDGNLYAGCSVISTNDGDSWEIIKFKKSYYFLNGFDIDSFGNLYSILKDYGNNTLFLYISTDKGVSWSSNEFGSEKESISSLMVANDTTIFVVMNTFIKKITLTQLG